jgi:hypothetical protein
MDVIVQKISKAAGNHTVFFLVSAHASLSAVLVAVNMHLKQLVCPSDVVCRLTRFRGSTPLLAHLWHKLQLP